jgi:hypothetical protein
MRNKFVSSYILYIILLTGKRPATDSINRPQHNNKKWQRSQTLLLKAWQVTSALYQTDVIGYLDTAAELCVYLPHSPPPLAFFARAAAAAAALARARADAAPSN